MVEFHWGRVCACSLHSRFVQTDLQKKKKTLTLVLINNWLVGGALFLQIVGALIRKTKKVAEKKIASFVHEGL